MRSYTFSPFLSPVLSFLKGSAKPLPPGQFLGWKSPGTQIWARLVRQLTKQNGKCLHTCYWQLFLNLLILFMIDFLIALLSYLMMFGRIIDEAQRNVGGILQNDTIFTSLHPFSPSSFSIGPLFLLTYFLVFPLLFYHSPPFPLITVENGRVRSEVRILLGSAQNNIEDKMSSRTIRRCGGEDALEVEEQRRFHQEIQGGCISLFFICFFECLFHGGVLSYCLISMQWFNDYCSAAVWYDVTLCVVICCVS